MKERMDHVNKPDRTKWTAKDGDGGANPADFRNYLFFNPSVDALKKMVKAMADGNGKLTNKRFSNEENTKIFPRYVKLCDGAVLALCLAGIAHAISKLYWPLDFNSSGMVFQLRDQVGNTILVHDPATDQSVVARLKKEDYLLYGGNGTNAPKFLLGGVPRTARELKGAGEVIPERSIIRANEKGARGNSKGKRNGASQTPSTPRRSIRSSIEIKTEDKTQNPSNVNSSTPDGDDGDDNDDEDDEDGDEDINESGYDGLIQWYSIQQQEYSARPSV